MARASEIQWALYRGIRWHETYNVVPDLPNVSRGLTQRARHRGWQASAFSSRDKRPDSAS